MGITHLDNIHSSTKFCQITFQCGALFVATFASPVAEPTAEAAPTADADPDADAHLLYYGEH